MFFKQKFNSVINIYVNFCIVIESYFPFKKKKNFDTNMKDLSHYTIYDLFTYLDKIIFNAKFTK
jgi:hypothetical protein